MYTLIACAFPVLRATARAGSAASRGLPPVAGKRTVGGEQCS